ncbi:MAG TPA: S53 family peptidase, partial [Pirellulales bacterium]|nr:S53 family peptidase [Pirellulales bacterium]
MSSPSPYGLSPMQIRHAYGFDQVMLPGTSTIADGSNETIAIVDAYNSPNIRTDLAAFNQQFALPNMTSDQFKIVSQTGSTTNLPGVDPSGPGAAGSWDLETSLDVEVMHAFAPGANLLLVEANSSSASDLQIAADFARKQAGVVVVSMSFGYGELSSQTTTDATFATPSGHAGVTFVAATGDGGIPGFYPAFSPNVIAAGGTTLNVDGSGNIVSEVGWSSSGGGVSTIEPQPTFQNGVVNQYSTTNRTTPDVAFDGDPTTGASVYDSYDYGTATPWVKVGGTSLSAPGWAALIAIADQARASVGLGSLDGATQTLPMLYGFNQSDFNDITSGNNGSPAGPGYDLVTGRGTPRAAAIVNDLVGAFHVAAS